MKSKTRAPFLRYRYPARFVRLFIGLVLFGLSSALNVRSMLGLSPWNAFHQGLSLVSGWPSAASTSRAALSFSASTF